MLSNQNHIESENRFADLIIFVRKQVREYNLPIERATLIEDDLGITGRDAEELIIAFSKKYNVDISDFYFTHYFYDEPMVFNIQNRIVKPFTVGHLEMAMIAGKLDEKTINS